MHESVLVVHYRLLCRMWLPKVRMHSHARTHTHTAIHAQSHTHTAIHARTHTHTHTHTFPLWMQSFTIPGKWTDSSPFDYIPSGAGEFMYDTT